MHSSFYIIAGMVNASLVCLTAISVQSLIFCSISIYAGAYTASDRVIAPVRDTLNTFTIPIN